MSAQRTFPSPKNFADTATSRELSQYDKDRINEGLSKVLRFVELLLNSSTNQNIRVSLPQHYYLIMPELKKTLARAGWDVVYTTVGNEITGAIEIIEK